MTNDWDRAFQEHAIVVQAYVARVEAVPRALWSTPRAPGKWSPAEEALHIVKAYELAGAADGSAEGMTLVTSPLMAWMARTFYLPIMLRRRTFPRNAPAPREVRPDAVRARHMSREETALRIEEVACRAAVTLRAAATRTPDVRITHAYFGPLRPLTALRLLSAHTRHHSKAGS